jgi:signal transduction histidine kinase/CheY-like chemotaxis protein
MQATLAENPPKRNDMSKTVLEFVHRLLLRPVGDQPALVGLLGELAGAFQVAGAGLANLPDCRILIRFPHQNDNGETSWPWQEDSSLLIRARQTPGAIPIARADSHLLVTSFTAGNGISWVLWLEDSERETFSEDEAATLALAGHALSRWLASDARPRWADQLDLADRQQRLETTASVTRRLAHDFGNVLTGILGFTELAMGQQVPANTQLHSHLNEVYRAAQNGAHFTQQLRLFSRRQSASSRPSQLAPLLADQEARLFAAQPTGLNFRMTVPADLPLVGLDTEHLHQILTALLDNAREALMGPGSISISARQVEVEDVECLDLFGAVRPGPHIEIIIADTGIGLSPDVQHRLFADPFFTSKPRRRGFGLAVAYGILHAHKGGIRLYPGEERGVVVRVLLPVAPTIAVTPNEETPRVPERQRGERILVVDDEREVLQLVSTSLERAGYRVEAVHSGEAALQAYFAQPSDPFRLVLTDVLMPGVGGVELVRRLLRRDPNVRVLFMSGHVSSDFTQSDFANHAFDLVAKPFRADQLSRAVRATLDRQPGRLTRTAAEPAVLSGVSQK